MDGHIRRSLWIERSLRWEPNLEVKQVAAWLLPRDVVTEDRRVLDATSNAGPAQAPIDRSLPGALLRILQNRPELLATHSSDLTWTLPDLLEGIDLRPAPGLLTSAEAEGRQGERRAGNAGLRDLVDGEDAARIRVDRRWWDASTDAGRIVEPMTLPRAERPGPDGPAARLLDRTTRRAVQRVAATA